MKPLYGTFHDAETGETITRELTVEEVEQLPKPLPPLGNTAEDIGPA